MGGLQFPAANKICGENAGTSYGAASAGNLYALDLAGACLGALVISAYLVPWFGFARTACIMSVVAAAPALPALRCLPRRPCSF